MWPMNGAFLQAKTMAANVPSDGEKGDYTAAMFLTDFPQFSNSSKEGTKKTEAISLVPEHMLELFIDQANGSVLPGRWGSLWRMAAGLYVAHFSAMYLKTYAPGSSGISQVAMNAQPSGMVKTATMGDVSVSYDNSAITSGTEKWGAWNATQYGQQLITMARMVGMGGMYVI